MIPTSITPIQRNLVIGIAIAAVLLGLGIYIEKKNVSGGTLAPASGAATSTADRSGVAVEATGDYTIQEISEIMPPDYRKPVSFSASVSAEARASINASLAQKRAALTSNPTDFNAWISLGALYHTGGDERTAEEVWLYAAALAPQASLPYDNLGDLYLNYLKEYVKSESAFKKAIAADAQDVGAYQNLFSLYTEYGYKKGTAAAEDILKKGIAANPGAYDLETLLARYYTGLGRTAEAKLQYEAAIKAAEKAGAVSIAEQLKAEEAAIAQ